MCTRKFFSPSTVSPSDAATSLEPVIGNTGEFGSTVHIHPSVCLTAHCSRRFQALMHTIALLGSHATSRRPSRSSPKNSLFQLVRVLPSQRCASSQSSEPDLMATTMSPACAPAALTHGVSLRTQCWGSTKSLLSAGRNSTTAARDPWDFCIHNVNHIGCEMFPTIFCSANASSLLKCDQTTLSPLRTPCWSASDPGSTSVTWRIIGVLDPRMSTR
mmetsp:Transcript_44574/g.117868  ORF Transcript_44574/g.117868 Transcript_44574/m.117868 type:complete len:216 (-) Transcript_44574:3116-3763(-)